ncbi:MAG TPA: HAMP domain-containing histidine kinase [Oscillatoriaceae cyanobacterium M33_DOE_052]|uniref:histidine kinase n=1 Tax=Planktothricoides sp. SpSt-374 TaxID=2282167 RepID=A0A7C3ZYT7_9CYAN|nr:HAMP domain-containing histidine kinase [Oscillatoriaceae cyanobacterium M33_DOE_052]
MAVLPFLFGLTLGIGLCLCQQFWIRKQLRQMLQMLQNDGSSISLPIVSRLRRAIAMSNREREQLQAEILAWQHLLQIAPFGFLQVDEENQLIWCNHQAQQLLHIQKWHPEHPRLLLKFVRDYELDQLIEQTREQQEPAVREWVFHPASHPPLQGAPQEMLQGRALTLRGYSWPLPQGQVGVFLENRQPLVELAQARNQWVSDLAHELRTPLTSIQLVAEMLPAHLQPPWTQRAERLLGEINRLIELVQEWLELCHLEAEPYKNLSRQPVELKSLIHRVWQTIEPLARQKQLTLSYSGPDLVSLLADESALTRVFLNIFDNSICHSLPQQQIQVVVTLRPSPEASTHPTGESTSVLIDMIDSGAGFRESDLPHVFERLYRGDPARSRQAPHSGLPPGVSATESAPNPPYARTAGSGLGLAIVKQIVQAHNGTIHAKNHPETGGAWLQIQLPYS